MSSMGSLRPSGRHQRKLRNYILDRHFQLKYASYLAGVALLVGASSGVLLWQISEGTLEQSQASVQLGEEILAESKKVSEVVAMNIVKDPVYADNPALKAAFEADSKRQAEKQLAQQRGLEEQAERLASQRTKVAALLAGLLIALVAGLWCVGIVVTHRVAGPVFKMKRQLRALEKGDFSVPTPLRRGDELKQFFDAFNDTVRSLRARHQSELDQLTAAVEQLEAGDEEHALQGMKQLREQLQATLKEG